MLNVKLQLHGIEETVTRPILVTVTNDLKPIANIPMKTHVVYNAEDKFERRKDKHGNVVSKNSTKADYLTLEVEEVGEDGSDNSLTVFRPDNQAIYQDEEIGAFIIPVYLKKQINIRYKYSTQSKSNAFATVNMLSQYTASDNLKARHSIEYSYVVPAHLVGLMLHIKDCKAVALGVDGTVLKDSDYLETHLVENADILNTHDGDVRKSTIVIREAQGGIEGWCDDDLHQIKPSYDESMSRWTIEFTYSFIYEKPVSLIAKYPDVVYNKLIHKKFRTFVEPTVFKDDADRRSMRGQGIHGAANHNYEAMLYKPVHTPLKYPYTDQLPKYQTPGGVRDLLTVKFLVEPYNPTGLFNIRDIPKVKLKDSIIRFISESEGEHVGKIYQSMFYIYLLKGDRRDYDNEVRVAPDGTLYTVKDMDIRYLYRAVFAVVSDIDMVSKPAKDRFNAFIAKEEEEAYERVKKAKEEESSETSITSVRTEEVKVEEEAPKKLSDGRIIYSNGLIAEEKVIYVDNKTGEEFPEGTKYVQEVLDKGKPSEEVLYYLVKPDGEQHLIERSDLEVKEKWVEYSTSDGTVYEKGTTYDEKKHSLVKPNGVSVDVNPLFSDEIITGYDNQTVSPSSTAKPVEGVTNVTHEPYTGLAETYLNIFDLNINGKASDDIFEDEYYRTNYANKFMVNIDPNTKALIRTVSSHLILAGALEIRKTKERGGLYGYIHR